MNKYKYEVIYKDLISSFSPAYVETSPWYVGKSILPIYKEIRGLKKLMVMQYYLNNWYKTNKERIDKNNYKIIVYNGYRQSPVTWWCKTR